MYFSTKPDSCTPSSFHSVWTHKHFAVEMALCSIWSLSQTHWVWNIIWCLCIVMPFWNLKYSGVLKHSWSQAFPGGRLWTYRCSSCLLQWCFQDASSPTIGNFTQDSWKEVRAVLAFGRGSPVMLIEPKDKVGKNRRLLPPAVFPECSFPARTTRLAMMAKTRGDLWAEDKMNKWCAFQTPGRLI